MLSSVRWPFVEVVVVWKVVCVVVWFNVCLSSKSTIRTCVVCATSLLPFVKNVEAIALSNVNTCCKIICRFTNFYFYTTLFCFIITPPHTHSQNILKFKIQNCNVHATNASRVVKKFNYIILSFINFLKSVLVQRQN